jgi:hypothetical protein
MGFDRHIVAVYSMGAGAFEWLDPQTFVGTGTLL